MNFLKDKAYIIIKYLIFLCILLFFFLLIFPPKDIAQKSINKNDKYIDSEVESNKKVTQYFVSKIDIIDNISILLSNYNRDCSGCYFDFELYDENDKLIQKKKIDASKVVDNKYHKIKLNRIKEAKGKLFKMIIIPNGCKPKKNSFSYYKCGIANDKVYLIEGDTKNQKSLVFNYSGKNNNYWYLWYPLTFGVILYTVLITFDDKKKSRKRK